MGTSCSRWLYNAVVVVVRSVDSGVGVGVHPPSI